MAAAAFFFYLFFFFFFGSLRLIRYMIELMGVYENLWLQEYIVYMGDLPKGQVSASSLHANLLQEVTGR